MTGIGLWPFFIGLEALLKEKKMDDRRRLGQGGLEKRRGRERGFRTTGTRESFGKLTRIYPQMKNGRIENASHSGSGAKEGGRRTISLWDALCDRRSVRHYTDQAVEAHTLKDLLDYAVEAPSAVNSQPWSFVIVQNRNLLNEISFEAKRRWLAIPMDVRGAAGPKPDRGPRL